MGKTYRARSGHKPKGDPEILGAILQDLCDTGDLRDLKAVQIVDAARDEKSPLHAEFEWDDGVAAELHRLTQARLLVRCIYVETTDTDGEDVITRAFVSVQSHDRKAYTPVEIVMTQPDMRKQVIEEACEQLRQWRAKYSIYVELAQMCSAIDGLLDRGGRAYRGKGASKESGGPSA